MGEPIKADRTWAATASAIAAAPADKAGLVTAAARVNLAAVAALEHRTVAAVREVSVVVREVAAMLFKASIAAAARRAALASAAARAEQALAAPPGAVAVAVVAEGEEDAVGKLIGVRLRVPVTRRDLNRRVIDGGFNVYVSQQK